MEQRHERIYTFLESHFPSNKLIRSAKTSSFPDGGVAENHENSNDEMASCVVTPEKFFW